MTSYRSVAGVTSSLLALTGTAVLPAKSTFAAECLLEEKLVIPGASLASFDGIIGGVFLTKNINTNSQSLWNSETQTKLLEVSPEGPDGKTPFIWISQSRATGKIYAAVSSRVSKQYTVFDLETGTQILSTSTLSDEHVFDPEVGQIVQIRTEKNELQVPAKNRAIIFGGTQYDSNLRIHVPISPDVRLVELSTRKPMGSYRASFKVTGAYFVTQNVVAIYGFNPGESALFDFSTGKEFPLSGGMKFEVHLHPREAIVVRSPSGTRHVLALDNPGILGAEISDFPGSFSFFGVSGAGGWLDTPSRQQRVNRYYISPEGKLVRGEKLYSSNDQTIQLTSAYHNRPLLIVDGDNMQGPETVKRVLHADTLTELCTSTVGNLGRRPAFSDGGKWVATEKRQANGVSAVFLYAVVTAQDQIEKAEMDKAAIVAASAKLTPVQKADAQARFKQAFELFQAGEFDAAILRFRQGLEIDPANAIAHYYAGETYDRLDRRREAQEHYRRVISLAPDSVEGAKAQARLGR